VSRDALQSTVLQLVQGHSSVFGIAPSQGAKASHPIRMVRAPRSPQKQSEQIPFVNKRSVVHK
jgi:hypothetical protein